MRARSRGWLAILLAAVVLWGGGCGGGQPEKQLQSSPPVTDDRGRTVELQEEPRRLVSLSPAQTEILFALGLGDRVVGVTDYCDWPEEARRKPKIGGFSSPNLEKVVAARPDLVVGNSMHLEAADQLEKLGIAVIILDPHSVEGTLDSIEKLGRVTGRSEEAAQLRAAIQADLDAVRQTLAKAGKSERPRVYYEVWYGPLMTAGPNTVIDDVIRLAGGVNVAADAQVEYPEYSEEVLLAKNPQVMIQGSAHGSNLASPLAQVRARPGWADLDCVKNGRV
ncbi:MAG: ABC transporter substrate-binding protein, partial [Syntrophomonadaceae bacterium]|nr:ABC transporter substrate-binding protein [Syntrophomonadaceae bacterium]